MTKQEFEQRTGFTIPEEQYTRIEQMYYHAGESIDKDAFCKDFKKHADSILLDSLANRCEIQKEKLDTLRQEMINTARFLIQQTEGLKSDALRKKAIEILGTNSYLREKIKLGIAFDAEDYELVTEFL